MYEILMNLVGKDNEGAVPKATFEHETRNLKTSIGPNLYTQMVDLSIDTEGEVNCRLMSKIVDCYKYSPGVVKKITNSSEQLHKHTVLLPKKAEETPVYRNYNLLAKRIEEKFKTMTKAFRFFDIRKV
jgi:hypothetical protein